MTYMMMVFKIVNDEPKALVSTEAFDTLDGCVAGAKAVADAIYTRDLEDDFEVICAGPNGEIET